MQKLFKVHIISGAVPADFKQGAADQSLLTASFWKLTASFHNPTASFCDSTAAMPLCPTPTPKPLLTPTPNAGSTLLEDDSKPVVKDHAAAASVETPPPQNPASDAQPES